MDKHWIEIEFDNCPECGDMPEVFTDCPDEGFFYDGDQVRCQECHHPGQFSCDSETPGYIAWQDEQ